MSGFVIFALVLTFAYVVYFAVQITLDLHGKKVEKVQKKRPMMSVTWPTRSSLLRWKSTAMTLI